MNELRLNTEILEQIFKEDSDYEETCDFLNSVIDSELEKDDIDFDLIDECINALDELYSEKDGTPEKFICLLNEEKFLKKLRNRSIIRGEKYKKIAAMCAAAALLFAVGSMKTESGQTVVKSITNKIADVFKIEHVNDFDEIGTGSQTVSKADETTSESQTEMTEESTEEVSMYKPVIVPVTERETQSQTEATMGEDREHTAETPVLLERIYCKLSKEFKNVYTVGENIDLTGLSVFTVYSDGSDKQIPVENCNVSVPKGFLKDPGKYKVTVTYKDKSTAFTVTVNALPQTVILNSIYGTFPENFEFTVSSFDDVDLGAVTVTAVYSDGSEKEISQSECEITVEKDFMGLENKALVTVDFEGRSFSFILTEEVMENEEI